MTDNETGKLGRPDLQWKEDGSPWSTAFEDGYYSNNNGLEETRHVFLKGNDLPNAWAGKSRFTIGETGFGTGLNFLAIVDLWLKERPEQGHLTYISVEAFPLSRDELKRSLVQWTELAELSAELIESYPDVSSGYRLVEFPKWNIRLILMFGDCRDEFARLMGKVDCWFLDGFAPSRNESMWSQPVYDQLARCSATNASLATFTAAGHVRRGLESAGFEIERVPGYHGKRHMTVGRFHQALEDQAEDLPPWFHPAVPKDSNDPHVAIIGAGIAGTSLAWHLSKRGIKATLIDETGIASGASGNRAGVMKPRLTLKPNTDSGFFAAAYDYAIRFYGEMGAGIARGCGIFDQAMKPEDEDRFRKIAEAGHLSDEALTYVEDATDLTAGWSTKAGLYYKQGTVVDGERACHWLAGQAAVECLSGQRVGEVERTSDGYVLLTAEGEEILSASHLVICAGSDLDAFSVPLHFQPQQLGGQVSFVSTEQVTPPPMVIMAGGYITPGHVREDGQFTAGASFRKGDVNRDIRPEDHEFIRKNLTSLTPWESDEEISSWQGRASVRAMSPDRFPIAGQAPSVDRFNELYAELHHGPHKTRRRWSQFPSAEWQENYYILGGLGSRGFVTAPLMGAMVASQIAGDVLPVPVDQYMALSPARFLIRRLQKSPDHRD